MKRNDALLGLIVPALIYFADVAAAGSCSSAKLCCQGRDSGCVIQKESPNAIITSPRDKPCYCDHACLKLADCCDDFKETCGVVDCAVSEWSLWTPCDSGCGSGTQRRTRLIEVSEKNGGKHCPRLNQVRTCRSFHNCRTALHPQLHEKGVAILTLYPDEGNGTEAWIKDKISDESPSCVAFTIVRASKACSRISNTLSEGSQICVERHGNEILERLAGVGRWKLSSTLTEAGTANTTCHGKWIGDTRIPIDCNDERCKQAPRIPHVSQLFRRTRRSVGVVNADKTSRTKSRTVRRRRRGRRRKRSKRKRSELENP